MLFDSQTLSTEKTITFPACTSEVWHCFLPGVRPGTVYGFRVYGPWNVKKAHLFNPQKVLLDPYARGNHIALPIF